MTNIRSWSTTAGSNNSASPNGAPEGMAPSGVNDTIRQGMASTKTFADELPFYDSGDTPSRASAATFKIATDVTARYEKNRRIKCLDATTLYGLITASTYSAPDTLITVGLDSGSLTSSLTAVALSVIPSSNLALPYGIGIKGADVASATTTDLSSVTGDFVDVTGTTTITALGTVAAGVARTVRFTGALTLTYNATSLILPGSASITTADGDVAIFRSLGSGNWKCVSYAKADGSSVVGGNTTEDSRTNTVNNALTVTATTSGTPAAGIGTGILIRAESGDEAPSNFGSIEFAASDVTAGSEDTYFQVLTRRAGAALAAAFRFISTSAFKYIFTGAPTADRTITLPDTDISNWVVQRVSTMTGAVATGTTTIPADDTLPQLSTEGTTFLTQAITPKSASNKLVIDVVMAVNVSATQNPILALFQDSTENALATIQDRCPTTDTATLMVLRHIMTAGTTSATTFKVNAGCGGAATVTINGTAGVRRYAGVYATSIMIMEYAA